MVFFSRLSVFFFFSGPAGPRGTFFFLIFPFFVESTPFVSARHWISSDNREHVSTALLCRFF